MKTATIVIPDYYEVTRDGRVFSHRLRAVAELRQFLNGSGNQGYPSVYLYYPRTELGRRNRKFLAVYRLVAHVYLPPRPTRHHCVCHKDGNHLHSHADNLYWGTQTENHYDAYKHRRERQQLGLPFLAEA